MLIQNIIENDRSSRGIQRETEEFISDRAALVRQEVGDIFANDSILREIPPGVDPNEYVLQVVGKALEAKISQMAAYNIQLDPYYGSMTVDSLGSIVSGLEGYAWMGPGLITAIDQWVMEKEADMRIDAAAGGQPLELLEGQPAPPEGRSRQPVVSIDDLLKDVPMVFEFGKKEDRPLIDMSSGLIDKTVGGSKTTYVYEDGSIWTVPVDVTEPFYADESPLSDTAGLPVNGKIRCVQRYADGRIFLYYKYVNNPLEYWSD